MEKFIKLLKENTPIKEAVNDLISRKIPTDENEATLKMPMFRPCGNDAYMCGPTNEIVIVNVQLIKDPPIMKVHIPIVINKSHNSRCYIEVKPKDSKCECLWGDCNYMNTVTIKEVFLANYPSEYISRLKNTIKLIEKEKEDYKEKYDQLLESYKKLEKEHERLSDNHKKCKERLNLFRGQLAGDTEYSKKWKNIWFPIRSDRQLKAALRKIINDM